ncbi:MAG: glycosyltransferase [Candidatus Doudnabacteria bacterium]|nr:glycosyltransferase [Candidatus Doudnabacteria bacterium]
MRKITRADIVAGIPTLNEADTIGHVVSRVDQGLKKYRGRFSTVIINADNDSPDGTKESFLKTETSTPKIYLPSGERKRGKGVNVLNILKKAAALKSRVVLLFDGDVASIAPDWTDKYVRAILAGYDYATPFYARNEYDGSITNHICFPLLAAFFSTSLRQPIGGDFALSGSFAQELVSKQWSRNTLEYGADIFLTVSALINGKKIAQVSLGAKKHKPSLPKLGRMYLQVTSALFDLLEKNKSRWRGGSLETPDILYQETKTEFPDMPVDYKYLKAKALSEFVLHRKTIKKIFEKSLYAKLDVITPAKWCEILSSLFKAYGKAKNEQAVIEAGRPLYFGRQASFIKSTLELNHEAAEKQIMAQAKHFHAHRNMFVE